MHSGEKSLILNYHGKIVKFSNDEIVLQIFYFAIILAFIGTLFTLNGYFLIFRIPFFH